MLKKLIIAFVLGVSLLTSLTPWVMDNKLTMIVKLDLENQLLISTLQSGQSNFINQIAVSDKKSAKKGEAHNHVPMSVVSAFCTMAFALLFCVVRVPAMRIK